MNEGLSQEEAEILAQVDPEDRAVRESLVGVVDPERDPEVYERLLEALG